MAGFGIDVLSSPELQTIKGPLPDTWGGDSGISAWPALIRWGILLLAVGRAWLVAGSIGAVLTILAFVALCALWWRDDATGWWDTIEFMISDTLLPAVEYTTDVHDASDGESYAIWWAARGRGDTLWMEVPGGMSDGSSNCQQTFVRPVMALPSTDVCVFHMPGQGGTKIKQRFGPGLCDTTYIVDFLQKMSAKGSYKSVVIVGQSAGGMVVPNVCTALGALSLNFRVCGVMCGSPDYIRHTFEDQSSWMLRLDIFFTLWYFLVTRRSGLTEMMPQSMQFPWRPTWDGYMKPASALAMSLGQDLKSFEEFEDKDFCGCARAKLPLPVLRVHGVNDPVVRPRVLFEAGLGNVEVWWTRRGGHCGQWHRYPGLAAAIAAWAASK